MRSLWRLLLTWLLVFAVPAQALTVTRMRHCGPEPVPVLSEEAAADHAPRHRAEPRAGPHVEPRAEPAGHHALRPGGADRHVHAAEPRAADGARLTADAMHHGGHGAGAADMAAKSCSVCAACCLGAAPPSATVDLPAPGPTSTPAASPTTAPPSHVGGRLERPPRLHLA